MRQLEPMDLSWVVRTLPKVVRNFIEQEQGKLVLAGGFVRSSVSGERPNDIDLFCQSKSHADYCKTVFSRMLGSRDKDVRMVTTDNAYTFTDVSSYSVQFIHRWTYEKPEQIVESFDFTIACAAVWVDSSGKWTSLIADGFYADLAAKRLVYLAPQRNEDAGGSMLRVLKFYQRGFRIPLDSLGKVIARLVNGVDPNGVELISSEGTSLGKTTEERWGKIITGLLREVDPLVDPTHAAHLPAGESNGVD